MFIIIGGDGKEYGPVTAEQVRAWIAGGRADLDTKAKLAGTEEWRRLGDFPEFGAPSAPPPIGMRSPAPTVRDEPTAGHPAVDLAVAPRGRRLVARVIDWFIAGVAMAPGINILGPEVMRIAAALMQGRQPSIEDFDMEVISRGGGWLFLGWISVLLVQVVLISLRGQSLGKVFLKLRVVRVTDGAQAGFLNGWLLREAIVTAAGVLMALLPFIGPFLRIAFHVCDWCFIFRADQRCLHDLIAGTKVVRA